jgi:bacteriophage N4 adsorption protein B
MRWRPEKNMRSFDAGFRRHHPSSLTKLFNYLMPEKAMVQIPVFPIEPEMNFKNFFKYMISSTYADEFAENHTKDIMVRKQIKGIIPSAGVGTAFARECP